LTFQKLEKEKKTVMLAAYARIGYVILIIFRL